MSESLVVEQLNTKMAKTISDNPNHRVCQRCVMDSTAVHIVFDKEGHCNYCNTLVDTLNQKVKKDKSDKELLDEMIAEIKAATEGKKYNCVIGVSGGVDSTYLAHLVVREFGLNPIVVHLDNGWNSKLSVKNILKLIKKLKVDLYTHVIDWEEFKSMQKAYLAASVIDIEVLTDHAIFAILQDVAAKYDIQHILLGMNEKTELIMPKSWTFNKNDVLNIKDINEKFGTKPIKTYPTLGRKKMQEYKKERGIKFVSPLTYVDFNVSEVKELIQKELGWKDYGGKHYESIFTRFYQGYILPRKFKVDKRKAHYSSLICLGEMTRAEALEKLAKPTYDEKLIKDDYEYTLKKFDYTAEEFESILNAPVKSHFDYKTNLYSKVLKKFMVPTNPLANWIRALTGGSKMRI